MTRPVVLTDADADELARQTSGCTVRCRFVRDSEFPAKWSLDAFDLAMQSLPGPHQAKSFEIWVTSTEITIVAWAQDRTTAKLIGNHLRAFNPRIEIEQAPYAFPKFPANARIRVGRLRPQRSAKFPIEARFGRKGHPATSPMAHVLNSLPLLPGGATLVVQVLWRQDRFPWSIWPWAHLDLKPWCGQDDEALEEKAARRTTYYADIRIAESHLDDASTEHAQAASQAFSLYRRDHANSLRYQAFAWWPRRRVLRFLAAMMRRDLGAFRMWLWRRPRYSLPELSALIHPPPPGALIPSLAYASVKALPASGSAKRQAADLRVHPSEAQGATGPPTSGPVRKLKAADVEASLRRRGDLP